MFCIIGTSTVIGTRHKQSSNIKFKKVNNPITGLWGSEGSGRLRFPDSVTSTLEGGRLSALRTGRLYTQEYRGTHFLEAEPTPGNDIIKSNILITKKM
jgi:hypothetical protein